MSQTAAIPPDTCEPSNFVDQVLKGFGQILLQPNRWTGLFIIAGLLVGNWRFALAAMVAATTGTLLARTLKWPAPETNDGLYGFSPALTGVALLVRFGSTTAAWIAIIIGAALAAWVQRCFIQRKIPAYTFPFIVITWGIIFGLAQWVNLPPAVTAPLTGWPRWSDRLLTATNGYGQVVFQVHFLSGLLFFTGVLISHPIAALYGLGASLLGAIVAVLLGSPFASVQLGLFGFNPILTAIVFSGPCAKDGLWVLIGSLLTIGINQFLVAYPFLNGLGGALTFPFVAGTWLTLLLQKVLRRSA